MLDELNIFIRRTGIPDCAIERTAGLSNSYIYRLRMGKVEVTPQLFLRIRLACARIARRDVDPAGALPAACYRLAVVFVAAKAGVTADFILSQDPAKRATADPVWLKAARLRRIALYIANIYLNIPQADLARAVGMSKAAVSYALNDVEDERDTPEIEAILSGVEAAFS